MRKINDWTFVVVNSGLEMRNDGKEFWYRFDPTESKMLLDYLDEHRANIESAMRSGQADSTVESRK